MYFIRAVARVSTRHFKVQLPAVRKMSGPVKISDMRKPYKGEHEVFDTSHLVAKEPFANFKAWFEVACATKSIMEPNAMSLATATKDGKPSVRVVLMKGFDENGFVFFSNYGSRKGQEMELNPNVALNFYWCNPGNDEEATWSRQVRIEGSVERLPREASEEYFHSRPKNSQIGACVSQQSTVIASRQVLDDRKQELEEKYADAECLPLPDYWGGYIVKPHWVEFWQGQTNRIHDRIVFRRQGDGEVIDPNITQTGDNGWLYERLSP